MADRSENFAELAAHEKENTNLGFGRGRGTTLLASLQLTEAYRDSPRPDLVGLYYDA